MSQDLQKKKVPVFLLLYKKTFAFINTWESFFFFKSEGEGGGGGESKNSNSTAAGL